MGRKNVVASFPMITDGNLSADITSESTDVKNLDKASIRITWDIVGTPVGEVKLQALQEKDNTSESDDETNWFDVEFGSTITIDSTQTDHQLLLTQLPFDKIRLKFINTSGTGIMQAKITAKQVGG